MSLETWVEEFYPVEPSQEMTAKEAIEHSLRKWEGLREENLRNHGMVSVHSHSEIIDIYSRDSLEIGADSCALCVKFLYPPDEDFFSDEFFSKVCQQCPLAKTLGKPCDDGGMPYITWMNTDDPEPMIKALKETLKNA